MAEEITDAEWDKLVLLADSLGRKAGNNAASWIDFDEEGARRYLKGYEEGDPEIMDAFRVPDFSGVYSGDYTEKDLHDDLGVESESLSPEEEDELANAWMDAAGEAFWDALQERARFYADKENPRKRRVAR